MNDQNVKGETHVTDAKAAGVLLEAVQKPRQLVLFLDGTNNTVTGRRNDTNVLKLYEMLAARGDPQQLLYYDPGVGSPDFLPSTSPLDWLGRWLQRIYGLAYGRGIYENIRDAYQFLMRNWQPGDQIWIFGFSRGAFTARSVSGIVNLFGILDAQHESMLPTVLRVYFAKRKKPSTRTRGGWAPAPSIGEKVASKRTPGEVQDQIRQAFCSGDRSNAWVHFVGVWDTVESVGIPLLGVTISNSSDIVGKRIRHVRHALSLDELRLTFRPRIYNQANGTIAETEQTLYQFWFRGVHSDVGGGYKNAEAGLSDSALDWMVAQGHALHLFGDPQRTEPPDSVQSDRLLHDTVYSVAWWALGGLTIRTARWKAKKATIEEHPSVGGLPPPRSVWRRWNFRAFLSTFMAFAVLAIGYYLQAGALSSFSLASIDWSLPAKLADEQSSLAQSPGVGLKSHLGDGPFEGSIVWAMIFDTFIFLPAFAYVLARPVGWAYRLASGLREASNARPVWHWLGVSPLLMLAGDVLENALTMVCADWTGEVSGWQWLVQGALGASSTVKWIGVLGCLLVIALGLFKAVFPSKSKRAVPHSVP
ncbi:DUF2235 domain-containing protein [Variovorax sp. Sphag1AA]|uniref:T6SS phospholipase effector Tle1-like catalytic domain-containing protein n=1 Tax=Variovorax sp. Sphag1AA TaxID=2587027 RepID=UPI00160EAB55|nr:DUF2235 domain-containing protein [Variovorax sp. Sphag1AA]MBB3180990.1 uncharacterized protein (DUF2235 family) [Variovorax sp. Sphag1AA]